jgi:hypothetical protein
VTPSIVKKSVAAIAPPCAFRNVFQLVGLRPAGSIPFSPRTRLIVFWPTVYPRFSRAPWIQVYPHRLRLTREAATLRIREAKPLASQLLEESPVLHSQILDDVCLLAVDPSDQNEKQEWNRERHHDLDASSATALHNRRVAPRSQ